MHENAPSLLICLLSFISALFVLFSPETKDKPMPQNLNDFDAGPIYNYLFKNKKKIATPTQLLSKIQIEVIYFLLFYIKIIFNKNKSNFFYRKKTN